MGFSRKAIALCLIIAQLPMGSALANIYTPGSFSVDGAGSANYTIPIEVPPGTNGIAPNLALSYSSQSGVGQLGKGWALSGLSSITRCARTVAQDGALGGVNFDANDRFCLDGQRLVVVNGKAYGADGAEYRTERESFSKVMSYGAAGSGPAYFKVWTKSGQIVEYGATTDSRIEAQSKAAVRVWAVNRIQDISTNYLTVSYTEDSTNGEFYPAQISYTGNVAAATTPYASIVFAYEDRSDLAPYYVAGSLVNATKRLSKVQTKVGTGIVKEYRLTYLPDSAQLRSRLTAVTECDAAGSCLPPTKFAWQDAGAVAFTPQSWFASDRAAMLGGVDKMNTVLTLDINGDGKMDFVHQNHASNSNFDTLSIRPAISTGNGFTFGSWIDTGATGDLVAADVNGDGKSDLVVVGYASSSVAITVLLSTGDGFSKLPTSTLALASGPSITGYAPRVHVLDIDGDGRADIVLEHEEEGYPTPPSKTWLAILKSTGVGFTSTGWSQVAQAADGAASLQSVVTAFPADLNGDGKMDMIVLWRKEYVDTSNIWILPLYSDGQKLVPGTWSDTGVQSWQSGVALIQMMVPLDVNGDGLTDIVFYQNKDSAATGAPSRWLYTFLSTGNGFIATSPARIDQVTYPEGISASTLIDTIVPTDLNSDGRIDLAVSHLYTDANWVKRLALQPIISTGVGYVPMNVVSTGIEWGTIKGMDYNREEPVMLERGPGLVYGDFNGDGKVDILQQRFTDSESPASFLTYIAAGAIGDLVTGIETGIGSKVVLSYAPLTNSSVYTKDSGASAAAYPLQDQQSAIYAVNSSAVSNGSGSFLTTTYAYGGMKRDITRQMNLGMRWNSVTDSTTGIVERTENRQDWPYVGMPSKRTSSTGSVTLNSTETTYSCTDFVSSSGCPSAANKRYFAFATQSVVKSADLNGTQFPTVTTTTAYDTWNAATSTWSDLAGIFGNPTEIKVSTSDGFIKKTTNVYKNDTANWFIGRVTRTTQTNTTP